ncbi:hypothetical protein AN639_04895 [Candidatus Epulonipiscium fishelsonii]|uniref:Uncharacterized protein n=1 Tax=Candidatus Epulonipiscium fishelsonii TaxID=77094 RepID=A0ACC8XDD8_9FIRM|nr:hypothetical protein AN639_04895 [Epulopiscium sp. SCG-B05WGA-EpuloA1]ONI40817.1 hypothetical protein AN396_05200 [Epulopiscium sp. SCG-B11WGA-EpuloA1]
MSKKNIATFLSLIVLTTPIYANDKIIFNDIAQHWARDNIESLTSSNILVGYSDGTFRPNEKITRAEFAACLKKIFKIPLNLSIEGKEYTDIENNKWYTDTIEAVMYFKLMNDYGSEFKPNQPITREEVAYAIVQAFDMKKEYIKKINSSTQFTDSNQISVWAKDAIDILFTKGFIVSNPDGKFRPTHPMTRAEVTVLIDRAIKENGEIYTNIDKLNKNIATEKGHEKIKLSDYYKDIITTKAQSMSRWGYNSKRTIFKENNILHIVDSNDSIITIHRFDITTFKKVDTIFLSTPLPIYGGFLATENNYFVISGKNINIAEEGYEDKEVIKIEKYDKNFMLKGTTSIKVNEISTTKPFDAGNVAMSLNKDKLIIHTTRTIIDDKYIQNPKVQLTILIDIDMMEHENSYLKEFQEDYANPSFNQFVEYDGTQPILLHHGNAQPRAVAITKYGEDKPIVAFKIAGAEGADQSGLIVGGFEIADNKYLTAINRIDYNLATGFSDFVIEGLEKQERNIVVLITDKYRETTKEIVLTDYVGTNSMGSVPKLISLGKNKFMVLWMEFINAYGSGESSQSLKYVIIDENGNKLSDINTFEEGKLSMYVQPIASDGKVIWVAGEYYYSIKFL